VNEIGQTLFLQSNTLTPITKKLEKMGFVTREREDQDQRKVRVSLTAKGKDVRKKTGGFFEAVMELSGLSRKEFIDLQRSIVALRDHLEQMDD